MDIYARIGAEEFAALVAGKPIALTASSSSNNNGNRPYRNKPGHQPHKYRVLPDFDSGQTATVRLILSDIGWGQMIALIRQAMEAEAYAGDDPPEPCIILPGEPLRV